MVKVLKSWDSIFFLGQQIYRGGAKAMFYNVTPPNNIFQNQENNMSLGISQLKPI